MCSFSLFVPFIQRPLNFLSMSFPFWFLSLSYPFFSTFLFIVVFHNNWDIILFWLTVLICSPCRWTSTSCYAPWSLILSMVHIIVLLLWLIRQSSVHWPARSSVLFSPSLLLRNITSAWKLLHPVSVNWTSVGNAATRTASRTSMTRVTSYFCHKALWIITKRFLIALCYQAVYLII